MFCGLTPSLEPHEDDNGGILITQKRKGEGAGETALYRIPRCFSLELSFQLDSDCFLGFDTFSCDGLVHVSPQG